MKKLFFDKIASVVMVAMMAAMCVTLTACGGSDDDPLDNPNPSSQGGGGSSTGGGNTDNVTTVRYFVPCMEWGYTHQQVADWMQKVDWLMLDIKDGNVPGASYRTDFGWTGRRVEIDYIYEDGADKLKSVVEWYYLKSEAEALYVVSETEKAFGVKMVLEQALKDNTSMAVYKAESGSGKDIKIHYNKSFECYVGINRK